VKQLFTAILLSGVVAHAYAQNSTPVSSPLDGNTTFQALCVNDDGYLKATNTADASGATGQHLRRCENNAEPFVCVDDDGYLWLVNRNMASDRARRANDPYRIHRCKDAAGILPGGAAAGEAVGNLTPLYVGAGAVGAAVIAGALSGGGDGHHDASNPGGGGSSGTGGTTGTTGTH